MANEDKAARYHRRRRAAGVLSGLASAACLVLIVVTGASAALRDAAQALTGGRPILALLVYALALAVLHELLAYPIAYYRGVVLDRRYGLWTGTAMEWWRGQLKAGLAAAVPGGLIVVVTWLWLVWQPQWWWIGASGCAVALMAGLARVAPVVLLPFLHDTRPLGREALAARLTALAARAGAPVIGVYEWRLGEWTPRANAVLAGLGSARRILLSDTLLESCSDEEIEVIVAHELAHDVHRDLASAALVESIVITAAFRTADLALEAWAWSFGLAGKADIAALPIAAIGGGAAALVLRPIACAWSRASEWRADRFALALTGNAPAFVGALKRLAARNLAEEHPPPLVRALFHTHPPAAARIEHARQWGKGEGGRWSSPQGVGRGARTGWATGHRRGD